MVSGGLGSLGLLSAAWLLDSFFSEVCLLGRTGRLSGDAYDVLAELSMRTGGCLTATRWVLQKREGTVGRLTIP